MKVLPKKLSSLLAIALRDLKKAERSKKYRVAMEEWHNPNGQCAVCAAGAVMAYSLGAKPTAKLFPSDFAANEEQLEAIDAMRSGDVGLAGLDISEGCWLKGASMLNRPMTAYGDDRKAFWKDQRKLLKDLREAGL